MLALEFGSTNSPAESTEAVAEPAKAVASFATAIQSQRGEMNARRIICLCDSVPMGRYAVAMGVSPWLASRHAPSPNGAK